MATKETVTLGPEHPPKEESIKAFKEIQHDLKRELVKIRHDHDKHEPSYFAPVSHMSDADLTHFSFPDNLEAVRVGTTAYGIHLLGKVRIPSPDDEPAYIHVRLYSPGSGEEAKLHCIRTEEVELKDGGKKYRGIFGKGDGLEWFDT